MNLHREIHFEDDIKGVFAPLDARTCFFTAANLNINNVRNS